MARIVPFAVIAGFAVVAALSILKYARTSQVDWKGVAIMVGFVAVAFYLRETAGLPQLL